MEDTPGTDVANLEAELQKDLANLSARVGAPPSNRISTKGKKFTLPTGESNTSLQGIILDWRHALANYPGVFNANAPQDPDCFAIGTDNPDSGLLKPHPLIENPHNDNCATCPKNQWGSDSNGRGKACKNQIRAVLVSSNPAEDAMPLTLFVSPSGLKNWNAYLTELANVHGLAVQQVITEITFDPNETYPKLQFAMLERHPFLANVLQLRKQHIDTINRPIELKNKG